MMSLSFEEMTLAARACDIDEKNNVEGENNNHTNKISTSYWNDLLDAVHQKADRVGSDLHSIWKTLEDGRMKWLTAVSAAHPIKVLLQKALENDNAQDSAGDVSDAMMVWIYSICVNLVLVSSETKGETVTSTDDENENENENNDLMKIAVDQWVTTVNMTDKYNPLKGYQEELWDPRNEEWRGLDVGAQEAAERGGANLLEAWKA